MRRKLMTGILLAGFFAGNVWAQSDPALADDSTRVYHFPELVVTATRVETPSREIASAISVLTADEIAHSQKTTVADALRSAVGVDVVSSGGIGKPTAIFIRGANPDHTLVLLDGVEINDPSAPGNSFDFANLSVENIARIEMLRGPQSTLYGSNAIGGVINIITKHGRGDRQISFSADGGAYNTFHASAVLQGTDGGLSYALTGSSLRTDGYSAAAGNNGNSESDGTRNITFTGRIGLALPHHASLDFAMLYLDAKTDIDKDGRTGDDPNYTFDSRFLTFRSTAGFSHFHSRWQHQLVFSVSDTRREILDKPDALRPLDASKNFNKGLRTKLDWQNNLLVHRVHTITVGVEAEEEKAESTYDSESAFGAYVSKFPRHTARTIGYYVQEQLRFRRNFYATAGIRRDHHSRFGDRTTYRFAPAFLFAGADVKLKATLGTGFNSPTLYELFDPLFGNPGLRPEKSFGWDIGFEQTWRGGRLNWGVTYFRNRFDDLIGFGADFRSVNIDRATSRGLDLSLGARPGEFVRCHINFTYTNTRDESAGSADFGEELLRRPAHKAGFVTDFRLSEKASVNLYINWVGKRTDKDFEAFPARRVTLDPYTLVNITAAYAFSHALQLHGRIDNLLDKHYEEVLYYGTAGRSAYLGLKLSL